MKRLTLLTVLLLTGCSGMEESENDALRERNKKGQYITRSDAKMFEIKQPQYRIRGKYPWEDNVIGDFPKITKEFFRCKGNSLNPPRIVSEGEGEPIRFFDCGGIEKHSLYLRNGKEYIYPILLDLLNYIQEKTSKRVIITSGYRCPEHNSYVDPSTNNRSSKHMIGAEVDFYVQGLENRPESIVKLITQYYQDTAKYKGLKEYQNFERYDKSDCSTLPYYNKEIFVKIYKSSEGRNLDNRHSYPYINIQVRTDFEKGEKVNYAWKDAFHNYLRK